MKKWVINTLVNLSMITILLIILYIMLSFVIDGITEIESNNKIRGACLGMSNENLSCSKVYEKSQCLCCEIQYLCIKDVCGSKTTTNCVVVDVGE